jgi:Ca-activated chloride channel homolog
MHLLRRALLPILLSCTAAAQVLNFPTTGSFMTTSMSIDAIQASRMDFSILTVNSQTGDSPLVQSPSGSVSKLDLKAPWKAIREYHQGYQLLMQKNLQGSLDHLTKATAIYPSFVAAHNALGSTYLALNQNEQARGEFAQAVALDDHLPNSYLNLGCAELALQQYSDAEESLRKASSIAPLDLKLQMALAYGEFANHDYPAVLETTGQVHGHKHKGVAVVHFFAAGAWEAQNNLSQAQKEMETLLQEDPQSSSTDQFRKILEQIKAEQISQVEAKSLPPQQPVTYSYDTATAPTSQQAMLQARQLLQDIKEKSQIAEAEAEPDPACVDCNTTAGNTTANAGSSALPTPGSRPGRPGNNSPGTVFRAKADEVAVFFSATNHGKSVTDLSIADIRLHDDNQLPVAILGFRNESQLPLRLGLVIDTSDSVTDRIAFEEAAATKFLQAVVTDKNDLAFVIGVNNSVLMVQDFTADQTQTARAINQLAPGGGTALWDAVAFAADKLASRPETQPVARMLVIISDGEDNSSATTLKEAIASAQRGQVAVYTVTTRDAYESGQKDLVGDHALRALSELTGGIALAPGSVKRLNGSLAELQQVVRGRYLVSYRPAAFQRDGRYRTVDIEAEKGGQKFRVFARKGYYASDTQTGSADR